MQLPEWSEWLRIQGVLIQHNGMTSSEEEKVRNPYESYIQVTYFRTIREGKRVCNQREE